MEKLRFERGAGVLCHISSLPGRYGIGSLGKEAYEFADFLQRCNIKYWQILPLVQTGYGDSPYQSVCGDSGNPYFIDLVQLREMGLLTEEELRAAEMPSGLTDYGGLYTRRYATLKSAFARFETSDAEFAAFVEGGRFNDYALFMSLKSKFSGSFNTFPSEYKFRHPESLSWFKAENMQEYLFWQFVQFVFERQWQKLKAYVNNKGIKIIGDIPLYMAYDSADLWAHPEIFRLDEDLNPTEVAGVPPDYFSATGQLWGNPLYDWHAVRAEGYKWWTDRIERALALYDIVRIDHFRGFDRYYAIPASAPTAQYGEWRNGPGAELFSAAESRLGRLPFIAEDLGVIDEGVVALREATGFPGMKIMLFAFDGNAQNEYLPKFISENSVTYTGTHDNDTALGFILGMDERQFTVFKRQLSEALWSEGVVYPVTSRQSAALALVRCALGTKSDIAVVPIQDILSLDNSARMNTPSTPTGNWQFRLDEIPSAKVAAWLKAAVIDTGRG